MSTGWGASTTQWSADRRTLTLTRKNREALHPGETILFILDYGLSMQLRDSVGNVLPEYVHHFVILGDFRESFESVSRSRIVKIAEDPAKGFHWPYYLAVPAVPRDPCVLFVEPNNTGFPTLESHIPRDAKAEETACLRTARVNGEWKFDVPVLVPTFPRSYGIYTQSGTLWLPQDCNCPELERPDLQLAAMIEDATDRLRSAGWTVHDKVFMNGFSASGGFTEMFALLHPEHIKAAACGGGVPSIPDGSRLAEIAAVTRSKPDLRAYCALPILFYCGDRDPNYSPASWDAAAQSIESARANFTLALYPGVGHNLTSEVWADLGHFFEKHLPRFDVWSSLAGGVVDGCSVSSPPVLEWDSDEPFRRVEAHFACNGEFAKAVKVKFRAGQRKAALKPAVWKNVLMLPGAAGGEVFWRLVGTLLGKKRLSSRTESFVVTGADSVGNPRISHASRSELGPPTLSWECSCNVRFKAWFEDGPDLGSPGTKRKRLSSRIRGAARVARSFRRR
ncbi:MAG: alpha/beta hydrolase family protein [Planctomycetota bacterium]